MIDFRYHLVSLAAVLIALSVGIVLGAGPLNDGIGQTLNSEVTELRQEKDDLRAELGDAERGAEGRDDFDQATLAQVVDGRLSGRSVALVVLPQAEDDVATDIAETLEQSGATVTEPVELDPSWVSADAASSRAESGGSALQEMGLDAREGTPAVDDALTAVLSGRADGSEVDEDARSRAWSRLTDADLVGGPSDLPSTSELVVVVGAPVSAESAAEDPAAEASTAAESWVRLSRTLDEGTSGAVLAGSQRDVDSEEEVSVVTTARDSTLISRGLSTVDVPEIPMGRADVVLALQEQLEGESGHYGLGADATASVPDL